MSIMDLIFGSIFFLFLTAAIFFYSVALEKNELEISELIS